MHLKLVRHLRFRFSSSYIDPQKAVPPLENDGRKNSFNMLGEASCKRCKKCKGGVSSRNGHCRCNRTRVPRRDLNRKLNDTRVSRRDSNAGPNAGPGHILETQIQPYHGCSLRKSSLQVAFKYKILENKTSIANQHRVIKIRNLVFLLLNWTPVTPVVT